MNIKDQTAAAEHAACSICMKEIPTSEAVVPEVTDSLMHFCGLTCYNKWKNQTDSPDFIGDVPSPSKP
jgi:hypothetical protein